MRVANCRVLVVAAAVLALCGMASGRVADLGERNHDLNVRRGAWFVKYYAPWCGHCQRLAPLWNEVGSVLDPERPVTAARAPGDVRVARVDCTRHKQLCRRMGVRGYPTLLLHPANAGRGDKPVPYTGKRTVQDMVAFARSHAGAGGGNRKRVSGWNKIKRQ